MRDLIVVEKKMETAIVVRLAKRFMMEDQWTLLF